MTVYIMTHKDYEFPSSEFYKTVGLGGHAGKNVYQTDSSSTNHISNLNKYYCELTGIYHVWQTASDPVIGICHYRRYFNFLPIYVDNKVINGWVSSDMTSTIKNLLEDSLQQERINTLLENYDIIVPKAFYTTNNIGEEYKSNHDELTWNTFIEVLDEYYGPHKHSLAFERRNFYCNMLIAKRSTFQNYCSNLFPVINEVFSRVGTLQEIPDARYQPYRYPGYLAERFMSAFINAYKLKYYEAELIITN